MGRIAIVTLAALLAGGNAAQAATVSVVRTSGPRAEQIDGPCRWRATTPRCSWAKGGTVRYVVSVPAAR